MSAPPPAPGSKESRLAVALGRVEFWRIWSDEAVSSECRAYFASRLRHWRHTANAIQLES